MKRSVLVFFASLLVLIVSAHGAWAGIVGDYDELDQSEFRVRINDSDRVTTIGQVFDLSASANWMGLDGTPYPNADHPDAYWYRYWGLTLDWSATIPGVVDIVKSGDYGQEIRVTTLKEGTTNIVVRLIREDDPNFVVPVRADSVSITVKRDINEVYNCEVAMSGIPNTMAKVGQTCSLTAEAGWFYDWDWSAWNPGEPEPEDYYHVYHYPNPRSDDVAYTFTPWYDTVAEWYEYWGLELRWRSDNPAVVAVEDQYGEYNQYAHLVSLSEGKATIYVDLVAKTNRSSPLARDSVEIDVTSASYTNIHPRVWENIRLYNTRMSQYGEQLGFAESDPANVAAQSFQSAFTGRFGLPASQVTEIADAGSVVFDSAPSFAKDGYEQLKPSMRVAVSTLASSGGALLPVAFTYNLSWEEISELLGRDVTSLSDNGELFGRIGIAFEDAAGAAVPVIDKTSYAQALSAGALEITSGGRGLTLTLQTMLADVNVAAAHRAELIDGSLIVPDGKADGTSSGSMWLVRGSSGETGGGTSESSGGGGGGCSAGAGSLSLAALCAVLGLRRRR